MEIAMIGLGKMGANMTTRLLGKGHRVVVFDLKERRSAPPRRGEATGARTLDEVVGENCPRRAPSGVDGSRRKNRRTTPSPPGPGRTACPLETSSSTGGNSNYKDTIRAGRPRSRKRLCISSMSGPARRVGASPRGYSMMVGGEEAVVERLRPIFEALAPRATGGGGRVGPSGAGHFVKMVHNGIEYGLMQAYAEGFELMRRKEGFDLDLGGSPRSGGHGSVVRSGCWT